MKACSEIVKIGQLLLRMNKISVWFKQFRHYYINSHDRYPDRTNTGFTTDVAIFRLITFVDMYD